MRPTAYRLSLCALACVAMSGLARADVTAEQVWENWRGLSGDMGQTVVTSAETRSGDRLIVSGAVFTLTDPQAVITSRIDEIVFRERGDGTVEVTMSPAVALSAVRSGTPDKDMNLDITLRQEGLTIIVTDEAEGLRHDIVANRLTTSLDRIEAEDDDTVMSGTAVIEDLTGTYLVGGGATDLVRSALDVARVTIDMEAESARDNAALKLNAVLNDMQFSGEMREITAMIDAAEARKGLPEGFGLQGRYLIGSSSLKMDFTGPDGPVLTSIDSGASTLDLLFNDETLRYDAAGGPTTILVKGPSAPVPEARLSIDAARLGFAMPTARTDAPQDISAITRFEGLTLGPDLWSLFDPSGLLPRDPLDLIVDIAGKARFLVDPFDPAAMAAAGAEQPIELHDLDLRQLLLSGLGAKVTGTGGFTFDNSDLISYDGFPKPVGEINLTIDGANQLIDRLSTLGLLPQNEAMNFRMLLGLFARPGDTPDSLTSKIEMRPDGTVHANGQRLK